MLLAALLGMAVGWVGIRLGVHRGAAFTAAILVAASHGVLDAFTDGGKGIALWWPFSSARVFAPWRPIPVSQIGLRALGPAGLDVMARELLMFLPLFAVALWPGRQAGQGESRGSGTMRCS
jgi:inner membrane protein